MMYVGEFVDIQKYLVVDFLNFIDIVNEFKSLCGFKNIKVVHGKKHKMEDNNIFVLIENDYGIRNLRNVLNPENYGVNFYVVKLTDALSNDVDDGQLHRVIKYCDAQTSMGITWEVVEHKAGAGSEHGANEAETNVNEGVESKVSGGQSEKRTVEKDKEKNIGSDTSKSSDDDFKDDIYNAIDENEVSSNIDDWEDVNIKFSMNDDRTNFTAGMTFANDIEIRSAVAKYGISKGYFIEVCQKWIL